MHLKLSSLDCSLPHYFRSPDPRSHRHRSAKCQQKSTNVWRGDQKKTVVQSLTTETLKCRISEADNLSRFLCQGIPPVVEMISSRIPCSHLKEVASENVSRNSGGGTKGEFQSEKLAGTQKKYADHVCVAFWGLVCLESCETQGVDKMGIFC